jgi:hypothetical protein
MYVYINNVYIKSENRFDFNVKIYLKKAIKQNNKIAGVEKLCRSSHDKSD